MALPFLFIASLLAQAGSLPSNRLSLSCGYRNEDTSCHPQGKLDHHRIDHYEIVDGAGKVQFEQDAPKGGTFSEVLANYSGAGFNIGLDVNWNRLDPETQRSIASGIASARLLLRVFAYLNRNSGDSIVSTLEITPQGLVSSPPVICSQVGPLGTSTGVAVACNFPTGYFRFFVPLEYDFDRHQTVLMPMQNAFAVSPPSFRDVPKLLATYAELKLYSEHKTSASSSSATVSAGMFLTWYQSVPDEKLPANQLVQIMAAWAPISLKGSKDGPDGLQVVSFDKNDVWLQVQMKGRTGWIHGDGSFSAIGLPLP